MRSFKTLLLMTALMLSQLSMACDTSQCSVSILPITNQVIAINSGNWGTSTTWNTGVVPGSGKNVVIPAGVTVSYNLNRSLTATPVRSLLVSGVFNIPRNINTTLVLDTLVVDSTGVMNVGTSTAPMLPNVAAKIVFAGGDLNVLDDPQLKGRGLLNHGTIAIHGAPKTPYMAISGTGPVIGNVITLKSAPTGWRVGDSVLVTGSDFVHMPTQSTQVTSAQYETHDEIRVITAISGSTITLNSSLGSLRTDGSVNKHERPHPGMDIYMANMTRNVQLSTAAANVSNISRRGHTMFMTSPNVSINNASFVDLGRSDKSFPLTTKFANGVVPGSNPLVTTTGSATVFNSNMRGRYPVHFHKIGAGQSTQISFTNNVILRSPGWGVSLHSSNANIAGNVSFDIFSSHFVTEDGDERGHFDHNLAVKAIGDTVEDFQSATVGEAPTGLSRTIAKGHWSYDNTYDSSGNVISIAKLQDDGQVGDCFWMQSRNIDVTDNIANSCSGSGFMFFHRHVASTKTPTDLLVSPHRVLISNHIKTSNAVTPILIGSSDIPLVNVMNNVSTASHAALSVIKASNIQDHNIYNHIKSIKGFNIGIMCLEFGYTGHYLVEDIECYSNTSTYARSAINTNILVENTIFKDFKLIGWDYPIDVNQSFQSIPSTSAITFINGTVKTKTGSEVPFDPSAHIFAFNVFPRELSYYPDLHKVVEPNADMVEGSGFLPTLSNISLPNFVAGQWGAKYKWTATLNDSAGVAPFSSTGSPFNINSFESKWPGTAIRARWEEKVNNVFVNRTLLPDGSTCLNLEDHFSDRVNRAVVPINVCIPMTVN